MRIEINPRNLLNLEQICEVLNCLHPIVLNELVEMERNLGEVLGIIKTDKMSLKERKFLTCLIENRSDEELISKEDEDESAEEFIPKEDEDGNKLINKEKGIDENSYDFYSLKKYLKLKTDDYIPMKISVEVDDPVIGRKVRELVRALGKTRAPEQFYFNKREMDEYAYFAEGYGLGMNKEQKKKMDDFNDKEDVSALRKHLVKENLLYIDI